MSIRPLISTYLLMLSAIATGFGASPEPKAETENLAAGGQPAASGGTLRAERKAEMKNLASERNAAAERGATKQRAAEKNGAEKNAAEEKADEGKAAASGYFKIKVEVELRGMLTCTKEAATISTDRDLEWVLDFGEDKEMRTKAKGLDGKTVLVKGSTFIRYDPVGSALARKLGEWESHWKPEKEVAVKSVVAATKE